MIHPLVDFSAMYCEYIQFQITGKAKYETVLIHKSENVSYLKKKKTVKVSKITLMLMYKSLKGRFASPPLS